MIKLEKIEDTDIYEFSINGDVDSEGVDNLYMLLDAKSKDKQKIKLLGSINEFPSFENSKVFLEVLKMKVKAIANISKCAVLSDKDWVEAVLPVGNFVTPGIPVKHFDLDERNKAIAWLDEEEVKSYNEEEYLSKMDVINIKGTNIYSFTVSGKIDQGGMNALYNALKDDSRSGKINLLAIYKDFDGFDSFKAFIEGLKLDFAAIGNIEKFAVVTDKKWVKTLAELESKILPGITIKGFTIDEEEAAFAWLK